MLDGWRPVGGGHPRLSLAVMEEAGMKEPLKRLGEAKIPAIMHRGCVEDERDLAEGLWLKMTILINPAPHYAS